MSKRARLWSTEAVERLKDARALVEQGRCKTILEALQALQAGVITTLEIEPKNRQAGLDVATQQTLEVLIREVSALRDEVVKLRKDADKSKSLERTSQPEHGPLVRLALWLERFRG
jgi:HEPN domain-containing protein